jgi:membrane protease YdiL (CAAX protease family)
MIENRKLTPFIIGVYLIVFFTVWSIRELIIQPVFLTPIGSLLVSEIVGEVIKLLVWTLPAILLIRHFQDDMWIGLKEMFITKPKWFKDAPILLVIFIPFLRAIIFNGGLAVNPDFQPIRLIGSVILIGVTEEIVFRGFFLNTMLKKMKLWSAIVLNGILFVVIHYPIWIYRGYDFTTFLTGSFSVFLLGGLFSYSFFKTKNIFIPIILHMIWNLQLMLFQGHT